MTRRGLLRQLTWLPVVGPMLARLTAQTSRIKKVWEGQELVESGPYFPQVIGWPNIWKTQWYENVTRTITRNWDGNLDVTEARGWFGWIESETGQVIGFIDEHLVVWRLK